MLIHHSGQCQPEG